MMTKLLSTFKVGDTHIEVWQKGNDAINPEDPSAAKLAVIDGLFGAGVDPLTLEHHLKRMMQMAVGYSNVGMVLMSYLASEVKPNDLPTYLKVLFTQMTDDEYDYLRKWEEKKNVPDGSDQEVRGE